MNCIQCFFLLLLSFSVGSCQTEVEPFRYAIPEKLTDGISTNSLSSVGIDSSLYFKFFDALPKPSEHKLSSFLLIKDDNLVLEKYWNGYHTQKLHDLRSATKSITSILAGIAIDKGFIKSENDNISKYLSEYSEIIGEKNITIKDLLNMNSGLDCDDWNKNSTGNEEKMYRKKDWINFVLGLNQSVSKPQNAVYCTGGVVVLGYIIQQASGMKLDVFADKYLFQPLGIAKYSWEYFDKNNKVDAGGHLCLASRDFLKIGKLMLNNGIYQNQQILSAGWVEKCQKINIKFLSNEDYGNLWWKKTVEYQNKKFNYYYALGNGGQILIILPSENMIAAFTGENYNNPNGLLPLEILKKVIIPSLK